ncbi:MAG: DUF3015 domain-containing protein [Spirochaetia bacterium]|nr:DUF3015 domain-containing protein [Spirochaetia bacterium]
MKKIIMFSSMAVLATALVLAPAKTEAKSYGMGGCGVGAIVIGSQPGMIQLVASAINWYFGGLQTSAITSGTSHCTDDGVIKAELEQRVFMAHNIDSLKLEAAKGEGEKINSLAYLMGCSIESMNDFGTLAKEKYNDIFNGEEKESEWVLYRLKEAVAADNKLAGTCTKVWL